MTNENENASDHPLLNFYRTTGCDSSGRRITQIWSWPHGPLERTHDYIQWLFPTWQESPVNPAAPILTEEVVAAFRSDPKLREHLRKSLKVMLQFYGLERVEQSGAEIEIRRSDNFDQQTAYWLTPNNHNHLRITRILSSLWALGCESEARAFFRCLEQIHKTTPNRITQKTFSFWRNAARADPNHGTPEF